MTVHLELIPLISLATGLGILIWPKLLRYIIAGYLIVAGLAGLLGY